MMTIPDNGIKMIPRIYFLYKNYFYEDSEASSFSYMNV